MENWKRSDMDGFWGEIAPTDHVVQIYENDDVFMDLLEGFVAGGIKAGDCVIVMATRTHLKVLESRLKADGFNVFDLMLCDQYIALDARQTLDEFMVDGWPDPNLFYHLASRLIYRARRSKRGVRVFGEMVALLWAEGNHEATSQLEDLWRRFCNTEPFCRFCAYPKAGFTDNASASLMHICGTHSKMVKAIAKSQSEILYQQVTFN
jgi:hypothetical protein